MAEEPVDDKEMRREFGAKAAAPSEDKPAQPGRAPRPQRGASPKGKRRATVKLGEPLDAKRHTSARARTAAGELTARLEQAITQLMT